MSAKEKYAFKMKLNPGMEDEYRRRHDEIWPELTELLKDAGVEDYSIHLDRESGIALRRSMAAGRPSHGGSARPSGDEALVGLHGRHHGDESRQLTGRKAAGDRLPYGLIP